MYRFSQILAVFLLYSRILAEIFVLRVNSASRKSAKFFVQPTEIKKKFGSDVYPGEMYSSSNWQLTCAIIVIRINSPPVTEIIK